MPSSSLPAHGLPSWARRPALTVALLAIAIGVSVAHGQPPPVDRASGVSVPVRTATPTRVSAGTLLLVSQGRVVRVESAPRRLRPFSLPPGVGAIRAWQLDAAVVVLAMLPIDPLSTKLPPEDRAGDNPTPRRATAAYLVRLGRPAVSLGPVEGVTPGADGRSVWLTHGAHATRVLLAPSPGPASGPGPRPSQLPGPPPGQRRVRLPMEGRVVGDTPAGLVVTTGQLANQAAAPDGGPGLARRRRTASPTPSPAAGAPLSPTASATAALTRTRSPALGSVPVGLGSPARAATRTGMSPDPEAVPLRTLLIAPNGLTRLLAEAEGLAAGAGVVLVRRADLRLGVVSLHGTARPRWLPKLSAVQVTGPAALDADGKTFAVLARVNEHVRLMVGPTSATNEADINVVALEGGPPSTDAAPPAFTASGRVLAVRPDGKIVYYLPGDREGVLLGADLPAVSCVVPG